MVICSEFHIVILGCATVGTLCYTQVYFCVIFFLIIFAFLQVNDGIVLPDKASLYLTAIEDAEYKEDKIECEPIEIFKIHLSRIFFSFCLCLYVWERWTF